MTNIIRFATEKHKLTGVHKHTAVFNAIISGQELLDLHMTGGKFTWSNNQENPTLERLDRILISKDWEKIFPAAIIHKLPREESDHNLLILSTQMSVPLRNLTFKFEISWLKDDRFVPLVKDIWDKPCFDGCALGRIQKIKKVK